MQAEATKFPTPSNDFFTKPAPIGNAPGQYLSLSVFS